MTEQPKGIELWRVICNGCGHDALYSGVGNDLVGTHAKLKCGKCGHRGATLSRGWHQWPPPNGVKDWKRRG